MVNFAKPQYELQNPNLLGGSSGDLIDNLSNPNFYDMDEFNSLRKDYQGAEFTINQKSELLQQKQILEKIRQTGRTNIFALEHEGSQGFVVQVSDICIKFKNHDSDANFKKEIKNYFRIEDEYNSFIKKNISGDFRIAGIQRHLCSSDYITMEYVPGYTLSLSYFLKDKKIKLEDLSFFLDMNYDKHKGLDLIYYKIKTFGINTLKECDIRTILYYLYPGSDSEIENIAHLDTQYLIDYVTENSIMGSTYVKRGKHLQERGIRSIDDHGDNLKYTNDILFGMDFGNISYK